MRDYNHIRIGTPDDDDDGEVVLSHLTTPPGFDLQPHFEGQRLFQKNRIALWFHPPRY